MSLADLNWLAVVIGAALAFGIGIPWYGRLFGLAWAAGSHGITPPETPPLAALSVQLIGTFLYALVIGLTETAGAIGLAGLIIVTVTLLQFASALFSQKSLAAGLIESGYVFVMGLAMIAAHVVL